MNFTPNEKTERISKLRKIYLTMPTQTIVNPYAYGMEYEEYNSGDRLMSLGFLRGWIKNSKVLPLRYRRSLAEAAELDNAEPLIFEDELFAGQLWLPHMTEEEQKEYKECYDIFSRGMFDLHTASARRDHITLDFEKLLTQGLDSIIDTIQKKKAEIDLSQFEDGDFSTFSRMEFYDCILVEMDALRRLHGRYIAKAENLAENAQGKRREELFRMAKALRQVPFGPARSFYEALQSIQFFLSNLFGLYALGRPDRYLLPLL